MYYYTQADFAIHKRMQMMNYYGDVKVCENITNAIAKVKQKLDFKTTKNLKFNSLVPLLGKEVSEDNKLHLIIKKQSENTYKLIFSAQKDGNIFLTVPQTNVCGLFSKVTITFKANEELDENLLNKTFLVKGVGHSGIFCENEILFLNGYFALKNT